MNTPIPTKIATSLKSIPKIPLNTLRAKLIRNCFYDVSESIKHRCLIGSPRASSWKLIAANSRKDGLCKELSSYFDTKFLDYNVRIVTNGLSLHLYQINDKMLVRVLLPEIIRLCWKAGYVVASPLDARYRDLDGVYLAVGRQGERHIFRWRSQELKLWKKEMRQLYGRKKGEGTG